MYKIDTKKMLKNTGINLENANDNEIQDTLYYIIEKHLIFLTTHNKNYTKEQYNKITDLYNIFNSIIK